MYRHITTIDMNNTVAKLPTEFYHKVYYVVEFHRFQGSRGSMVVGFLRFQGSSGYRILEVPWF